MTEPSPTQSKGFLPPTPPPKEAEIAPVSTTPVPTPSATPIPTPTPTPTQNNSAPPTSEEQELAEVEVFALQIGALPEKDAALAQATKAKKLGMETHVVTATVPNKGTWHRVQIGRFASQEEAMRFGQELQARKAISGFVLRAYQAAEN